MIIKKSIEVLTFKGHSTMNNQGLVCSWVRATKKILIYVDAEVCNLIFETIEILRSLSFLTPELGPAASGSRSRV